MSLPNFAISRSDSFEVREGVWATFYPKGQTLTILSIQPDGSFQTRPFDHAGAWETWVEEPGDRAVFHDTEYHQAFPLVK